MKPETCSFKLHEASGCWVTIHGRQVLRDNIGTTIKEKSGRPYLFWSSCMARTGRHGSTPWERMPPLWGRKTYMIWIIWIKRWFKSMENLQDESDAEKKIDACSQKLAVSDVSWNSRRCTGKWVPTPPTCMHQCLPQMKSETASSPMSQQLIQLTSETASFWVLPPILRQDLSSTSETASSFRTPPLHPPAAASSTAASNLLRVTKNFCYGSYLNGSTLSVNSDTE